jgi:hypothetical protein
MSKASQRSWVVGVAKDRPNMPKNAENTAAVNIWERVIRFFMIKLLFKKN